MKPFTSFESRMTALPVNNIDTDQIIPARFLKTVSKVGLGDQLFYDWRYDAEGRPKPDFILNQPQAQGAYVLLAGDNFGCGSSREHAPWALTQFGFRAVISTSFADIFKQNSLKNSLLPVVVPADAHGELFAAVAADPERAGQDRPGRADAHAPERTEGRVPHRPVRPALPTEWRRRARLHSSARGEHRRLRSPASGANRYAGVSDWLGAGASSEPHP